LRKAAAAAPQRRGAEVSGGVFASGMFAKENAVTWEIHVIRPLERAVGAGKGRPEPKPRGRGSRRAEYE